jgi:polysaccharide deacetylase family protein (PEP-CTERM system associated)
MTSDGKNLLHCLSFDVEEHFQVSAFESPTRRMNWHSYDSRVERNTSKILNLLSVRNIHATFFVLGWVAERNPRLVKLIASAGHEIASHGYSHQLVTSQTQSAFRDDIRKAKTILEDIISKKVCGYRAPSFSITTKTIWALEILIEEGYMYDSSIFPVFHDRYGIPTASRFVNQVKNQAGMIWEVPPSVAKIFGLSVPCAGGGYFRLYPYFVSRRLLQSIAQQGAPLVMYMHPWEFDPNQPRMDGSFISRLRHYMNLDKTEERLARLLDDFKFGTICESIPSVNHACEEKRRYQSADYPQPFQEYAKSSSAATP